MNNEEYIQKLTQELETYKQSEQEAKEIIAELKFKNKKLKDIIENKFEEENITDTAVTYLNDQNIYLSRDNKNLKEKINSLVEKQGELLAENKELKEQNKKYSAINEQDTKDYAKLTEKYNKMVEISKENLIKYEDLRIDNQKLIMEIENLKSQLDFEAQKQEILFKENVELKSYIKEDLVPHTKIYIQALEEIREIVKNVSSFTACDDKRLDKIQTIITEAIGGKQCQQ